MSGANRGIEFSGDFNSRGKTLQRHERLDHLSPFIVAFGVNAELHRSLHQQILK